MENLDEFLKGNETDEAAEVVEAVETPVVEATEPVEKPERPRGPDGKFLPKGEEQPVAAESVSPTPVEPTLEHPALLGERRRRQEAEDRLKALEAELQTMRQAPAPTVPDVPADFWDNPEAYIEAKAAALAEAKATQIYQQQIISRSINRVKGKYEDFDAATKAFGDMILRNPDLYEQMLAADEPAEFAYNQAKTELEMRQHGSLDALIKARVEAALAAQAPAPQPAPLTVPETLADQQSARGTSVEPFAVPSFDEILRRG